MAVAAAEAGGFVVALGAADARGADGADDDDATATEAVAAITDEGAVDADGADDADGAVDADGAGGADAAVAGGGTDALTVVAAEPGAGLVSDERRTANTPPPAITASARTAPPA